MRQAKLDTCEVNAASYPDAAIEPDPECQKTPATAAGCCGACETACASPDLDEPLAARSADEAPEVLASQAVRNAGNGEVVADHPHVDSGSTPMEQIQDMSKFSAQAASQPSSRITPGLDNLRAGTGTTQPSRTCRKAL